MGKLHLQLAWVHPTLQSAFFQTKKNKQTNKANSSQAGKLGVRCPWLWFHEIQAKLETAEPMGLQRSTTSRQDIRPTLMLGLRLFLWSLIVSSQPSLQLSGTRHKPMSQFLSKVGRVRTGDIWVNSWLIQFLNHTAVISVPNQASYCLNGTHLLFLSDIWY